MNELFNLQHEFIGTTFFGVAEPTNRKESSNKIVQIFRRYLLQEGHKTLRVAFDESEIACKNLSDKNIGTQIDKMNLSWYEKKYFVPLNIKNGETYTRVLINKNSLLKNLKITEKEKRGLKEIFDKNGPLYEKTKKLEAILKRSYAERALSEIGASKHTRTSNKSHADLIVRAVMRSPSRESRDLLERLHRGLKVVLKEQSLEGLAWLLTSNFDLNAHRGGFASAQSLQTFLNRDPKTICSSRLITGIETLLTSIAYKGIFSSAPENQNHLKMYLLCTEIEPMLAPQIELNYPDKYEFVLYDEIIRGLKKEEIVPGEEREQLSDPSDDEGEEMPIQENLPRVMFGNTKVGGNTQTWAGVAKESNVPIRYGVSGTASLNLAVAQWLLSKLGQPFEKEDQERLSGVLIIPAYHRAGYHSMAEVMVGVQNYSDFAFQKIPEILSPREALGRGLSLVEKAIRTEFRDAVRALSKEILQLTRHVEYTIEKNIN